MKSSYPSANDLQRFLEDAELEDVDELDLDSAILSGIAEFEQAVGRVMLATVDETRYFDPPGGPRAILDFREDLASLTSVTYQNSAITSGTDYYIHPINYASRGWPYWGIRFTTRRWTRPVEWPLYNTIAVTGKWGYSSTGIAENAWFAMLAASAMWLIPQIAAALSLGVTSWRESDISETYGDKPLDFLNVMWGAKMNAAVTHYKRVVVGI